MARIRQFFFIVFTLISFLVPSPVQGQPLTESSTISTTVLDTVMTINGSTSPNAYIEFSEGGNLIGTTSASSDGIFSKTFAGQTPGIHNIAITAKDSVGITTSPIYSDISLTPYTINTSDFFLPTTMQLSSTTVVHGSNLVVKGRTFPNAVVILNIDDKLSYSVTASSSGAWQYDLLSNPITIGQHTIYALVKKTGGETGLPTARRTFSIVKTKSSTPKKPSAPVINSPKDGAIIQSTRFLVSGTSERGSQIELYDGDLQIGGTTSIDGNWSLNIDITKQNLSLRARACDGDVCSDFSNIVNISASFTISQPAFHSKLDTYRFRLLIGERLLNMLTISSGQTPYTVEIDWGDGKQETIKQATKKLALSHIYRQSGLFNPVVKVTDASGKTVVLNMTVIVVGKSTFGWANLLWLLLIIVIMFLIYLYFRRRRKDDSDEAKKLRNPRNK